MLSPIIHHYILQTKQLFYFFILSILIYVPSIGVDVVLMVLIYFKKRNENKKRTSFMPLLRVAI